MNSDILTICSVLIVAVASFSVLGSLAARYLSDILLNIALIAFIFLIILFSYNKNILMKIFYVFIVFLTLKSIAIGFFISLAQDEYHFFSGLNPELYVEMNRIFSVLTF